MVACGADNPKEEVKFTNNGSIPTVLPTGERASCEVPAIGWGCSAQCNTACSVVSMPQVNDSFVFLM